MSGVLEKLFFDLVCFERGSDYNDEDYKDAMSTIDDLEMRLLNMLEGEEKELFIKYSDAWSTVDAVSTCDNFVKGFKMGTKIALEALDYK